MEQPGLAQAIQKLAQVAEQAGISVERMIGILRAGVSVETLLDIIDRGLRSPREEVGSSSHWIM
jgi:hypothetical protein